MSILNNHLRFGNFTSSQIYRLCGPGKRKMSESELAARPKTGTGSKTTITDDYSVLSDEALNYIAEKNIEREIGRNLNVEKTGRSALWGHFCEQRVHNMLPTSYRLIGKVSVQQPNYPFWVGSPDNDCKALNIVGDIKCYEPKKFVDYINCLMECQENNSVALLKENFPQEYWQLVSNACILGMDFMEAILYIPYFSELQEIRQSVMDLIDEDEKKKYNFIAYASYNELAWIKDGGKYKNLSRFVFEVPKEDKEFLTNRVIQASKFLITIPQTGGND